MYYTGIDYSMTCPSICSFDGSKCNIDFYTIKKKFNGKWTTGNFTIYGHLQEKHNHEIDRFDALAKWALRYVHDDSTVMIEDYAMGAKGRVFAIGENTGILKYLLWKNKKIDYTLVAPTAVKKFATGKGTANKDKMYEFFVEKTGINLFDIFGVTTTDSPISDIVDSYFISQLVYHNKQIY